MPAVGAVPAVKRPTPGRSSLPGVGWPYAASMAEPTDAPAPGRRDGTPTTPAMSLGVARNRWRNLTVGLGAGALLLVTLMWWATHPSALPVREGHVTAVTTPGRAVYVGMVAGSEVDRTMRLGGVHARTEATVPVEVVPLLCRGGSVSITTDPAPFCTELVDPTGQQLRPGDSLLVRVSGDEAGAAYLARLSLTFRSGLQVGTRPAGTRAVVAIIPPTVS